jgi:CheY-like chemotaxis protein
LVLNREKKYFQTGQISYDLIFLNLDMPIKDGYQACMDIHNFYLNLAKERVPEEVESQGS